MTDCIAPPNVQIEPQCQHFVVRKKRLCRMTVRPGRRYCGEHEPQPRVEGGQTDTRIPCPYDPKHTCYASKLEKHLRVCNARAGPEPDYIERDVNAPAPPVDVPPRVRLADVPADVLQQVINKVNHLYEKYVQANITTAPVEEAHPAVAEEWGSAQRAESSRRHLRQASALLRLAERAGLVRARSVYVELGAGKGQLSYFAHRAWCAPAASSRVLLVDRAALRHKRDNALPAGGALRVRADLRHVHLRRLARLARAERLVGLAKHLCGEATDYALRCVCSALAAGVVLAPCCHHRCSRAAYVAAPHLQELGISDEELDVMFGVVSWATCGDGRPRSAPTAPETPAAHEVRARVGRRAKALLDWGRVLYLRERGLQAGLCRFVPASVTPENLCIVATRSTDAEEPSETLIA